MNHEPLPPSTPFAVVVDDDPTQLNVLSGLVRKAGLEPIAFTGAEAALAAMDREHLPALIVTDLYMLGIDGWRFCRLLRSPDYAAFNQVPILVVSSTFSGDEPDRIAADLGAEAFLPSPVDGKRFVEQVRAILKGRHVRKALRVLIVENSETLAGMLKKAFKAHGYQADTALTVREAADAFARTVYDVAVLDYHLPDGAGDALLDAFCARRPDCVCLMMTTDPGPEPALDWMKRGAAACLHKPFEPDYLIELCIRARRERALLRVQDLLEERTRELRESEERYQRITEAVTDYIYTVRVADGRAAETVHGPGCLAITGYREKEFTADPYLWFRMVAAEDRPAVEEQARRILAGEESPPLEHRMVQKDGTERWVRNTFVPHCDEHGALVSYDGLIHDITGRKRAEQALIHSRDLMRYIIEHNRSAVAVHDSDLKYVYVSRRYLDDYKVTEKDVIGKHHYDVFPDLPQKWRDVHQKALAGEISSAEDDPYVREDGTVDWTRWECRPWYEANGSIGGIIIYTEVTTERKKAEETLRGSEERYRLLFDGSRDAMITIAPPSWKYTSANPAALTLFGVGDAAEFMTLGPWDVSPESQPDGRPSADKAREVIEAAMREGSFFFEWTHRRLDGADFPATVMATRLEMAGQVFLLCVVRDITERKRAEEEKATLEAQLRQAQKMESVGRLAGGVAHDFNNMLNVILGRTEMALKQVDPAGPLHADLEEIRKAAGRSADLTRQLLAFARKQTIAPKVIELNETVEGMLKMLRRLIGEDIDLAWRPGENLWPVKMDPSQIDQMLANLCVNARDAIADVGKVTIETENVALDEAYCANHAGFVPGEYLLLAVSDNGCGMDRETLDRLFEPFFTTKEMGKGTGLGLATVYGAVKQNDGFINVYSEPGQGTTFKIYLPRHQGKAEQARKEGPAEPAARGHETILLVEDEPAILRMTTMMLESQGYTVLAASTPGEAIHLAEQHPGEIHLLMTDVIMPEMNGRDLARHLSSIYPDLKRLYMSGYMANVIAHHGVLDPGIHFIQKPFSMKGLADKAREALDGE